LDEACGVGSVMPKSRVTVCSSGFGYASPFETHGEAIGLLPMQLGTPTTGRLSQLTKIPEVQEK